jgi:hypothetical protein
MYRDVFKNFRTESITKYTLTFGITPCRPLQRVMAAKLITLTHTIAIQLHLVAGSSTICNSRSRRPVRKRLDTHSYSGGFHFKLFSKRLSFVSVAGTLCARRTEKQRVYIYITEKWFMLVTIAKVVPNSVLQSYSIHIFHSLCSLSVNAECLISVITTCILCCVCFILQSLCIDSLHRVSLCESSIIYYIVRRFISCTFHQISLLSG